MVYNLVVIGGGISGVSCVTTLASLNSDNQIYLISASPLIKQVNNLKQKGHQLEEFEVIESTGDDLVKRFSNINIVYGIVEKLDVKAKLVCINNSRQIKYHKVCICTGARPKLIEHSCSDYVVGIRDTSSVDELRKKLSSATRIVVVGNGGIASELVYAIKNCQVVWAIKDASFGATFFDAGAAKFFSYSLSDDDKQVTESVSKMLRYTAESYSKIADIPGTALGPNWHCDGNIKGSHKSSKQVQLEVECHVLSIHLASQLPSTKLKCIVGQENITIAEDLLFPVYVELSNQKIYGCDLVVSATGVIPNTEPFLKDNNFSIGTDLGLSVNDQMLTSCEDVYAAGDVCTVNFPLPDHWFQMRLWTQARQMGAYAARCMHYHEEKSENALFYSPFDVFTHVTKFFGYKVVLLGLFNGQKLNNDYEVLLRVKERCEYIKVVMKDGIMKGAVLVGETSLEETFENLIMNQLDLSSLQDNLLNSSIDIEDYFD